MAGCLLSLHCVDSRNGLAAQMKMKLLITSILLIMACGIWLPHINRYRGKAAKARILHQVDTCVGDYQKRAIAAGAPFHDDDIPLLRAGCMAARQEEIARWAEEYPTLAQEWEWYEQNVGKKK